MAYQVLHAQGMRGTVSIPAGDMPSARHAVKTVIAQCIAQDARTQFGKIAPAMWKITAGKYKGDTIQIVVLSAGQGAKLAEYNTVAEIAREDKRIAALKSITVKRQMVTEKKGKRPVLVVTAPNVNAMYRASMMAQDQDRAMKRASVETVKPCTVCNGTGQEVTRAFTGFILVRHGSPCIPGPQMDTVTRRDCTVCNGSGREK